MLSRMKCKPQARVAPSHLLETKRTSVIVGYVPVLGLGYVCLCMILCVKGGGWGVHVVVLLS